MHGVGTEAQGVTGRIGGAFQTLGATIGGEFGDVISKVGDGIAGLGEHSASLGAKLTAGGGIVAGLGLALQSIGSADKQASDQLAAAVAASGHDIEQYGAQIESTVGRMENFGHKAEDTKAALQVLTQATNDPAKAIANMGLVADLAASKHIGLADAASLVAKIMGGGGAKTLAQFGIHLQKAGATAKTVQSALDGVTKATQDLQKAQENLKAVEDALAGKTTLTAAEHHRLAAAVQKVHDKTLALEAAQKKAHTQQILLAQSAGGTTKALQQLAEKTSGQASASVDNFNGKLDVVRTKIADWASTMGQDLGPALTVMGVVMTALGPLLNAAVFNFIKLAATKSWDAITTAADATAHGLLLAVMAPVTAAQWLLNAAMSANPIGLVVIAIVALIAILVLAWTHSQKFRDIVTNSFKFVWNIIQNVFGWVKSNWPLLLAILTGPIGLAVLLITKNWSSITGVFSTVMAGIKVVVGKVVDIITFPFRTAFNMVSTLWNNTLGKISFTIPSWVPIVGGKGFSFPQMPRAATGANVSRGGLIRVGEFGPETVSLPTGAQVMPLNASGARGGTYINVTVNGVVGNGQDVAQQVLKSLQQLKGNGTRLGLA